MKIEYTLKLRRRAPAPAFRTNPASEPQERPHRIARILALAHRLDELVRSGAVRDHGELAAAGTRLARAYLPIHDASAPVPRNSGIPAVSDEC